MPCKPKEPPKTPTPPRTPPRTPVTPPRGAPRPPSSMPPKRINKVLSLGDPDGIIVIKHFHPNVPKNKLLSNSNLPEVNCDVDVKGNVQNNVKVPKKSVKSSVQKPQSCHEVSPRKRNERKARWGKHNDPRDDEFNKNNYHYPSASKLKSRPFLREYRGPISQENLMTGFNQFPRVKSKSFTAEDQDKNMASGFRNVKRSFISVSSSEIDESYINTLRREIGVNRTEANDWLHRKSHLLQNNKIFNEKVENLRKEISKLINVHLEEKRERITELKTEIAEFRKSDNVNVEVKVYNNIKNELVPKDEKPDENQEKISDSSDIETCADSSDNSAEGTSAGIEFVIKDDGLLQVCDCRLSKRNASSKRSNATADSETDGRTRKKELKYCPPSRQNQRFISSRICEVNTLIDKVKDTLHDIKTTAKMKNAELSRRPVDASGKPRVDKGTYTDETFVAQVVFESPDSCSSKFYNKLDRPKTRRIDILSSACSMPEEEQSQNSESKPEELTSLERLRLKLNTISEMNESDISSTLSSTSESKMAKEEERVRIKSSSCNTDPVVNQCEETQAQPDIKSSGTQIVIDIQDCGTQTITMSTKQEKKLSVEGPITYEAVQSQQQSSSQLTVQHLPTIDITGDLVLQKVYQLSIAPEGVTHVHYKSDQKNVGYFEVYGDDTFAAQLSLFDVKKKVRMLNRVDKSAINDPEVISEIVNLQVFDDTTIESEPLIIRRESSEDGSNETVFNRSALAIKEMVYKSFQLLDNPNMHDPGQLSENLDVTGIDTSVYKTFINPEGFPDALMEGERKEGKDNKSYFKRKISHISGVPISKKPSTIDKDLPSTKSNAESSKIKTDTPQTETNSKLWDIGLYSSKEVQCCSTTDDDSTNSEIKKQEGIEVLSNIVIPDVTTSSYDKISLTLSYSTDTTDSSNNIMDKQSKTSDNPPEETVISTIDPNFEPTVKDIPPQNSSEKLYSSSGSKRSPYDKVEENLTPTSASNKMPKKKEEYHYNEEDEKLTPTSTSKKMPQKEAEEKQYRYNEVDENLTFTTASQKTPQKKEELQYRYNNLDENLRPTTSGAKKTSQKEAEDLQHRYNEVDENLPLTSATKKMYQKKVEELKYRYDKLDENVRPTSAAKKTSQKKTEDLQYHYKEVDENQTPTSTAMKLAQKKAEEIQHRYNEFDENLTPTSASKKMSQKKAEDLQYRYKDVDENQTPTSATKKLAQKKAEELQHRYNEFDENRYNEFDENLTPTSASKKTSQKKAEDLQYRYKDVDENQTPTSATKKMYQKKVEELQYRYNNLDENLRPSSASKKGPQKKPEELLELLKHTRTDKQDTSPRASTSKFTRQKDSIVEKKLVDLNKSSESLRPSADNTVNMFISGLTNTKSDELRKVMPKFKKTADKNQLKFHVLPVQVHGDCWPEDFQMTNPHLKLGDNGRYKDEENLFSKSSFSNFEDVFKKHRPIRSLPRYPYKKYGLETPNSDTTTMDDTISEGEVKCPYNGSIGEIHRCKSMDPPGYNRKHSRVESKSFKDELGGTVRERRSYFNHLITYYIDKKSPLNYSSSGSNSR